jgi:hypothetical protein
MNENQPGKAERTLWNDNLQGARRWHPRITPFRLAFILNTATFGISKAVLVFRDEMVSSTTVKWVAGVVLAMRSACISELWRMASRPQTLTCMW